MVLLLLALLMETAMHLYMAHADQTKKRSDRQYATQLAHSGLDWARACLAANPTGACVASLEVGDGTIEVTVERTKEHVKVRSTGIVLRGGARKISRTETMEFGPPASLDPPPPPDPGSPPGDAPSGPVPTPVPTPDD